MKYRNRYYYLEPSHGMISVLACPACKTIGCFTLYIDENTDEPLDDMVGKCDRKTECGYHFTPAKYFAEQRRIQRKENAYKPHQLEPYTGPESRHTCPACGKQSLAVYRSAYNNSIIFDVAGKCDRETECGYHLTTKKCHDRLKKRGY